MTGDADAIQVLLDALHNEFAEVEWMTQLVDNLDIRGSLDLLSTCLHYDQESGDTATINKVFFVILMGLIAIITHHDKNVAFKVIDDLNFCRETHDFLRESIVEWVHRVTGNVRIRIVNNITNVDWKNVNVRNLVLSVWNLEKPKYRKSVRKQLKIHPDTMREFVL